MTVAPKKIKGPYGIGPKNLPSPQPNVGAGAEADAVAVAVPNSTPLAKTAAAGSASAPAPAMTADSLLEEISTADGLLASLDQAAPTMEISPDREPGAVAQGLEAAARVADYPGGFIRSGLANVAGLAQGRTDVVTEEDLAAAEKGKAPSSEEYLRRLGVSEGGSFMIGGMKISSRGAAGFALDVATDPLTLIAKTVRSIPYLEKIIGAPGRAAETLGQAVYKSAVSAAEQRLAKKGLIKAGTQPLGEALIEAGAPIGNAAKLEAKVAAIADTMGNMRQALYDKATSLGVTIDVEGWPLKRAEAVLNSMREVPTLRGAADDLQKFMDIYRAEGKVTIDKVSKWKTQLYDALPASAWGTHGKLKGPAKKFKAALAADFRESVVGAGNAAEKGLGDAIDKINDKWGTLLNAPGKMGAQVQGSLGHAIDGAVLAVGGVKAAVVKKGYELATGPAARTAVGKALMEAGKRDVVNRVTRQGLAGAMRPPAIEE